MLNGFFSIVYEKTHYLAFFFPQGPLLFARKDIVGVAFSTKILILTYLLTKLLYYKYLLGS